VRNKNCAFLKKRCDKSQKKEVAFCFERDKMPCSNLDRLDRKSKERYGMSMVENLKEIQEKEMISVLTHQEDKYRCPTCGDVVSIHDRKRY
jgi:hypothetical protein